MFFLDAQDAARLKDRQAMINKFNDFIGGYLPGRLAWEFIHDAQRECLAGLYFIVGILVVPENTTQRYVNYAAYPAGERGIQPVTRPVEFVVVCEKGIATGDIDVFAEIAVQ